MKMTNFSNIANVIEAVVSIRPIVAIAEPVVAEGGDDPK